MGLPPWRWAALGASLAARSGGDVVELLISGEVRGAWSACQSTYSSGVSSGEKVAAAYE